MGSASGSGQTVLELITAGDVDAAAGFYDGRAPSVREYCVQLCSPELVDEATLAAFVDFRSRAANPPPDADADDILRRAARATAASRLDLRNPRSAECRATTELLAARMNGELTRSDEPLQRHLKQCSACRRIAERLREADRALIGAGGEAPPDHIRVAWIELVGQEELAQLAAPGGARGPGENGAIPGGATLADEAREAPEPEPAQQPAAGALTAAAPSPQESPAQDATATADGAAGPVMESEPGPQKPQADQGPPRTVRVRTRRGGVLGAVRRLGSSAGRRQ